jgi:S-adenosylmethionine hydrolase
MQWNDSYFIAADNGILSMLSQKIVPQRMVAINIHDRLQRSDWLMFCCFSGLSYRKGWITKRHWKRINSLKQITELKASISHDTNMLKGHVVYIDHFVMW